jgi:hypothetical protein
MPAGRVIDIRECGHGNINNTYLVTLVRKGENHFILQRIKTKVFRHPDLVMLNIRIATEHAQKRLQQMQLGQARRWEVPRVFMARDGRDHWLAPDGSFWRAVSFIDAAQTFDTIRDIKHAGEVGYAVGMFHTLLNDLPPESLNDTLEGFHITPLYLRHYSDVLSGARTVSSPEFNYCTQFVEKRSAWAQVLETAKEQGRLRLRPVHGDPKVNNIMMDTATGEAVGIVDLDTVKPGLVHYDIGDCLRSGCNPLGEETGEWEAVHFETDLCRAILQGYLSMASRFLTESDFEYMYDAVRLIAFELGLRFFTDYLEGDVYFRVRGPEHNLTRAMVQFRLAESIESQERSIRNIIRDLR